MDGISSKLIGSLYSHHLSIDDARASRAHLKYILAGNGIFVLHDNEIGSFLIQLSATSIPGLDNLTPGLTLSLPKIPFTILQQSLTFFKGVMARFNNSEAIVHVYFNRNTQQYYIYVPRQQVSSSICHYDYKKDDHAEDLLVAHIHSHNIMNASFSSIDDNDEDLPFIIYGLIKNLNSVVDCKFRIAIGKHYCEIPLDSIFDSISPVSVPDEWYSKVSTIDTVPYSLEKYRYLDNYRYTYGHEDYRDYIEPYVNAVTHMANDKKKQSNDKLNKQSCKQLSGLLSYDSAIKMINRLVDQGYSTTMLRIINDRRLEDDL